jgi:hypothetical protein
MTCTVPPNSPCQASSTCNGTSTCTIQYYPAGYTCGLTACDGVCDGKSATCLAP